MINATLYELNDLTYLIVQYKVNVFFFTKKLVAQK